MWLLRKKYGIRAVAETSAQRVVAEQAAPHQSAESQIVAHADSTIADLRRQLAARDATCDDLSGQLAQAQQLHTHTEGELRGATLTFTNLQNQSRDAEVRA